MPDLGSCNCCLNEQASDKRAWAWEPEGRSEGVVVLFLGFLAGL